MNAWRVVWKNNAISARLFVNDRWIGSAHCEPSGEWTVDTNRGDTMGPGTQAQAMNFLKTVARKAIALGELGALDDFTRTRVWANLDGVDLVTRH